MNRMTATRIFPVIVFTPSPWTRLLAQRFGRHRPHWMPILGGPSYATGEHCDHVSQPVSLGPRRANHARRGRRGGGKAVRTDPTRAAIVESLSAAQAELLEP
jgi:hypothetical protein